MTTALTIKHMLLPSFCSAITFNFLMVVAKLVPKLSNELDYEKECKGEGSVRYNISMSTYHYNIEMGRKRSLFLDLVSYVLIQDRVLTMDFVMDIDCDL